MVVGVAVSCTVGPPFTTGGDVTVSVNVAVAVPPAPVAVAVYVVLDVGVTVAEPEGLWVPRPGWIVTEVEFVELHVRVASCPDEMEVGDPES